MFEFRTAAFFHRFPQFFRIPPLPQTLSLGPLEPHCVNPATSIRITNKLSLTSIYYRATLPFELGAPTRPSPAPVDLCVCFSRIRGGGGVEGSLWCAKPFVCHTSEEFTPKSSHCH